jgi:hypothetical protein
MRNLSTVGSLSQLATSPDQHLIVIAKALSATSQQRLVAPHLYTFGSSLTTAKWLRRIWDGDFELAPGGDKFIATR